MAAVFRDAVAHQHQTLVSQQLTLLIPQFATQVDSQSLSRLDKIVECLDGIDRTRQLQEQCQAGSGESLHILRRKIPRFDQIRDAEHRLFTVVAEHHTMENVVFTEFQLVVLECLEQRSWLVSSLYRSGWFTRLFKIDRSKVTTRPLRLDLPGEGHLDGDQRIVSSVGHGL